MAQPPAAADEGVTVEVASKHMREETIVFSRSQRGSEVKC